MIKTAACIRQLSLLGALAASAPFIYAVADFENLNFAGNSLFENGANLNGVETVENRFGSDVTVRRSNFTSGNGNPTADFSNEYIVEFDSWSGWSYSKDIDALTSGFINQYSAIAGGGANGSASYGVAFGNTNFTFDSPFDFTGRGIEITNTTYVHNAIRDGDQFSRRFGDDSSTSAVETSVPDLFSLAIEGFNLGNSTGVIDFALADYRFSDDGADFIIDDWTFVDLSALGVVDALGFTFSSTDSGAFGINTPQYFAIDNIGIVPELKASTLFLGLAALLSTLGRRRSV